MRVLQIVTIIKITNKIMRKFIMMISIGTSWINELSETNSTGICGIVESKSES